MGRLLTRAHLARVPSKLLFVYLIGSFISESRGETLGSIGALLPPFLRNNFDDIVKTASDTCEALPLELLYSRQYTLELPLVDVFVFTKKSRKAVRLSEAHARLGRAARRHLVLYVPGWWNSPTDESSEALVGALLRRHPTVLVLDTRLTFSRSYVSAASRVNPLAHHIYEFIENLKLNKTALSSVHLIGFSLGAHVVGITGKLVQKNLDGQIGRITALDPAKPCFMKSLEYRLDKGDAKFVQVVHSSSGVLGLEQPVGHVDVYMNGVSVKQPECLDRGITIECDHAQAWKMYSASVTDGSAFMGKKCEDWEELKSGECRGNMTVLGYGCKADVRGLFLYKSENRTKRMEPKMQVFNLFDVSTWWNQQTQK